ncbi:MAG: hypothetical protein JNK15_24890 [Planctomycetes bacterium]|nr:hypothetical protein [Planctomycetota bacterium]
MTNLTLAYLVSTGVAAAQSWSITANAPSVASATAMVQLVGNPPVSNSASVPIGPVSPGGFLTAFASDFQGPISASAAVGASFATTVPNQTGPLAFRAVVWRTVTMYGWPSAQSTFLQAEIDLTLHAPQPVGGRLQLRGIQSLVNGRVECDVGGDGTIELSTATGSTIVNVPLHIGVTGALVRLRYFMGNPPLFVLNPQSVEVVAEFFPGEPVVTQFDTTGAGAALAFSQSQGQVTLALGTPTSTPLFLAFGAQPIQVQVLPTVTALVTLDIILATGNLTLPAVPLPPGTILYVQGLVLDASGTPRSSPSLRAYWP